MRTLHLFLLALAFAAAGTTSVILNRQPVTPVDAATQISKRLAQELDVIDQEIILNKKEWGECKYSNTLQWPIYIYTNKELSCWNNNKLLPPINLITDSGSIQLLRIAQSNFILYQKPLKKGIQAAALLMLTRQYPIQNDFLTSEWNTKLFPANAFTVLEPLSSSGVPVLYKGQTLFKINTPVSALSANPNANVWSVFFVMMSLVFLTLSLYKFLKANVDLDLQTILLCSWLVLVRLSLLATAYPRSFISSDIFSPAEFASSWFNPSLGDLWINVVFILLIAIYVFRYVSPLLVSKSSMVLSPGLVLLNVLFAFLLFSAAHYPILTIQTIAHNSNIDFSITSSLDFSRVRLVALFALVLTWLAAFLLLHIFLKFILFTAGKQAHRILLVGALLFAGVNYSENQPFVTSLLITWVLLMVIHFFDYLNSLGRIQYKTFSYLFLVIIAFVLNTSSSVYSLSNERERENQWRFAESYLTDRDSFGEFLLNDLSTKLGADAFIQTRLASPFLSKLPIQQKIRQVYLSSYFNKYDVRILLFNSLGKDLAGSGKLTLSDFIKEVDESSNRTDYQGIYRIENRQQNVSHQYVLVKPVARNGFLNGYVVVELSLKKSIPDNVYPELLVDNRFRQSLRPADLSYATFIKGEVESQAGDFDYELGFNKEMLGKHALFREGIIENDYQHVAVEDEDEVVTVISAKLMSVKHFFTNASFYLVVGLSLLLLFVLWLGGANAIRGRQLYYSARIQLLINLSFFIPLVIVSIVTLRMLSKSSQEQLNVTYLDRAAFLAQQWTSHGAWQDSSFVNKEDDSRLQELARVSGAELFLYQKNGFLKSASHRSLFDNQLMAPLASASALTKMQAHENAFIVPEQVGGLSFFVAYARLKQTNEYIAIPFYQSASVLQGLQIEALSDILVIFVFVFILLLFSSFLVSRWLTFPLELISATLQRTSLERPNVPLRWNANDEIGLMVKSYNDMLQKLKDSKSELERMQREQAWREIAQQVAHEIKNPLTPMKLTLQRLARSIRNKEVIPEQMVTSFDSMLEQVEMLNTIASSFSTFAKLPTASILAINARPILEHVCELYSQQGALDATVPENIGVLADPVLVQTIFSNIVLNALQAKDDSREFRLQITIVPNGKYWRFLFKDTGKGIEVEKHEKIFIPHFTTKETGSGLGLAIAKRGVEQMMGTISFTSVPHQGTTFIVELPATESE